jgi:hypothetical protein
VNRFLGLAYQSIFPRVAVALFSCVIGPFSWGSLNLLAKKLTGAGSMRLGSFCLVWVKTAGRGGEVEELILANGSADGVADCS